MRDRRPFRGPDRRFPLQHGPSHPLGFVATVDGKIRELGKDLKGLLDRIRYRPENGTPASYKNDVIFQPERTTVEVDVEFGGAGPTLCNYVVRDATLHSVPIMIEGPGNFWPRFFSVQFFQRYYTADAPGTLVDNLVYQMPIPIGKPFFAGCGGLAANTRSTQKYHLPQNINTLFDDRNNLGIVFFWNLIDRSNERPLADDLMPHDILLPGGYQNQCDGNLFELDVPMVFDRAGTLEFQFQLVTPILQLDSSVAAGAFGVDDRESGLRNQDVTVRAEIHGTKFYSERDIFLREAS